VVAIHHVSPSQSPQTHHKEPAGNTRNSQNPLEKERFCPWIFNQAPVKERVKGRIRGSIRPRPRPDTAWRTW
jgi:hypothetical protein